MSIFFSDSSLASQAALLIPSPWQPLACERWVLLVWDTFPGVGLVSGFPSWPWRSGNWGTHIPGEKQCSVLRIIHPRQPTCKAWPGGCWWPGPSALSWVFPFSNEITGESVTKSNPYSKGKILPIFWRDVVNRVDIGFQIWDEVTEQPERVTPSFYLPYKSWGLSHSHLHLLNVLIAQCRPSCSAWVWKDSNLLQEF